EDLIAQVLSRLPVSAAPSAVPAAIVASPEAAATSSADVPGRSSSRAWAWMGGSLVAAAAACAAWILPISELSADAAAHRLEGPALALVRGLSPVRGATATFSGPSQGDLPAVVSGKVA